jgi:hypothetical protein
LVFFSGIIDTSLLVQIWNPSDMIADEAMNTDPVGTKPDPAIVAGDKGQHAIVAVQALLQHGRVGPHSDIAGKGDISPAPIEVVRFCFDRCEVQEPVHPLAGYTSGFPVGYPLLGHVLPFALAREKGMAMK